MNKDFPIGMKLPNHLAIIPDGNRRWAKEHHLPTLQGHLKGFGALLRMAKAARQWGIHTTTVWIFSTENWQREKSEVAYLMKIEEEMIKKYLPELKKDGVRIIHLGKKDRISESFKKTLAQAEKETLKNDKHVLNIAVDYGGRDEILRAIKKYCHSDQAQRAEESSVARLRPRSLDFLPAGRQVARDDNLTEQDFVNFLDTANQLFPNPDLLIRTSGEMRTSGFLPWQMAYTEFVFLEKHLPDCTVLDLKEAILEYSRRERRFGGN